MHKKICMDLHFFAHFLENICDYRMLWKKCKCTKKCAGYTVFVRPGKEGGLVKSKEPMSTGMGKATGCFELMNRG